MDPAQAATALAGPRPAPAAILQAAYRPGADVVAIRGPHLLLDGRRWVPRGVNVEAWDAPAGHERTIYYRHAKARFGPSEFAAIKAFGADMVRFPVSQMAIDPMADGIGVANWSAANRQTYLGAVVNAVRTLRAQGFVVLLQMNDNAPSYFGAGRSFGAGVPTAATARAWQALAPYFIADRGVMFSTFDEPYTASWQQWGAAQQAVISAIRGTGARNVLVVEGIEAARVLSNGEGDATAFVHDPLNSILYGVHAYFDYGRASLNNTPAIWTSRWGDFARTHPVIVDEWTVSPTDFAGCQMSAAHDTSALLHYLKRRGIGLSVWAWDVSGTVQDNTPATYPPELMSFSGFRCGVAHSGGPGQMISLYYRTGQVQRY